LSRCGSSSPFSAKQQPNKNHITTTMAPSPSKRHTISTPVNPLLSSFSTLSLDQLGPPIIPNSRSKKSSNPSPLKGSKSSSSLRSQQQKPQSSAALSSSLHKALSRPINRDDLLGRDLVRKDWGSSSSSSPAKKPTTRKATSVDRYITRDVDSCQLESHARDSGSSGTNDRALSRVTPWSSRRRWAST